MAEPSTIRRVGGREDRRGVPIAVSKFEHVGCTTTGESPCHRCADYDVRAFVYRDGGRELILVDAVGGDQLGDLLIPAVDSLKYVGRARVG